MRENGKIKKDSCDGRKWIYEYYARGLHTGRVEPNGTVQTFGYDACGRIISDVRELGSASFTRSLVYDPVGFLKKGTDGGVTALFNLSGSTYKATAYGLYDTSGHLTSIKSGNSLTRTENWNKTKGFLESYGWGISGKAANTLAWNNRGNITAQTKTGISYTYQYDKKNQLKQENRSSSPLSVWTYDANGNRNTESRSGGSAKTVTCYPKSDLIKSDGKWKYNYDANGNMVAKGTTATATGTDTAGSGNFTGWTFSATSGEVWTYEYDLCNRLVKVNHSMTGTNNLKQVTAYKYDYRDLMVCRTVGTGASAVKEYFAYSPDGKLLYTEKGTEKQNYVYANGKLWCELVTANGIKNTYYHHTDYLGTTVCVTDSNGKVVWECEKDSFGVIVSKSNSSFTPNFTGKLLDENTGLYYFNARWYDAEMGRFITEDPARDGVNWYVYCSNNPFIYVDPDGRKLELTFDKTNQSLTINFTLNGKTETFVWNYTSVTSRVEWGENNRNKHENTNVLQKNNTRPTQFPNGDWEITGVAPTTDKEKYGTEWLMTNASQELKVWNTQNTNILKKEDGTDETVIDDGYFAHYTQTNTHGCIGILSKSRASFLVCLYKINKKTDDSTAILHVIGDETKYSSDKNIKEHDTITDRK